MFKNRKGLPLRESPFIYLDNQYLLFLSEDYDTVPVVSAVRLNI